MTEQEVFGLRFKQRFGDFEAKGWKFRMGFVGDEMYFKSPRMKEDGYFVASNELTDSALEEIEVQFVLKEIERQMDNDYNKMKSGVLATYKRRLERGEKVNYG